MAEDRSDDGVLSRRELLKRAGLAVGAVVVVPALPAPAAQTTSAAQETAEALRTFTRLEYETLDAICSRIIPTDASGPGAKEARAARYIDWGLSGALVNLRDQYAAGLAAVEAHAIRSKGSSFAKLSPEDQDAVVSDLAQSTVPQSPQGFFNTVRTHTIQGTFSDPFYGGNADYVGWDLIRYPGVRVAVPAEYQQWGTDLKPNHQSAYDSEMFSKGTI
ncbi:MAG TPA: gluconate 2-dehydrogenase subunit 3 family protein [Vicinamibacterales bacterium]|jgi:gluconate 2-dehydrogenase gamma chain|nr:gluconate 2-dehydrogenase subunit 3 family protein [Vicinamibacterales bacterium]